MARDENPESARAIFIANPLHRNQITQAPHAGARPVVNQYSIPDLQTVPKVAKVTEARLQNKTLCCVG